jgi:hypothetical protein
MFSAVDGFRTVSINVADGYISTFNSSVEVHTTIPNSSGATLYVGSRMVPSGQTNQDMLWMKINNNNGARITTQKEIGNLTTTESGFLSTVDNSENVYVVGQSYANSTYTPAYVAKFSSTGTLDWQKEFFNGAPTDINGLYREVAVESGGGNIYCAGYNINVIGGSPSAVNSLVKYNSSGTIQYQEESAYSNVGNVLTQFNTINDLTVDSNDSLYLTGLNQIYDISNVATTFSGALQKRYANGTVEWDYTLANATNNCSFNQTVVDSSNNVYFCGYYEANNSGILGKLHANGTLDWQREYANTDIQTVCVDDTGNLFLGGRLNTDFNKAFCISIDTSNGNISWQNFVSRSTGNLLISDINYSNSFIYLGGYTQGYTGNFGGFTMKLPSNGNTTGSYGEFSFSTGNITDANLTITDSGNSLNFGTTTYSNATASLSNSNGSVARKIIPL